MKRKSVLAMLLAVSMSCTMMMGTASVMAEETETGEAAEGEDADQKHCDRTQDAFRTMPIHLHVATS